MDLDRLVETATLFGSLLGTLLLLFVPITIGLVLIQRWLGTERLARLLGGERLLPALLKGTVLGAVTPFCGCATIPLLLGLLRARVRFAGVAAFMLASPLLNPYILGVVALLFGGRTAGVYAAFAVLTSVGLGALWERSGLEHHLKPGVRPTGMVPAAAGTSAAPAAAGPADLAVGTPAIPAGVSVATVDRPARDMPAPACGQQRCSTTNPGASAQDPAAGDADAPWAGWRPELSAAYRSAVETLRPMLRPLLLGVVIGAAVYGFVPEGWLAGVLGSTTWWTLPLAAVLGLPLYLRGEAAFPIGAGLLAAGVGAGPMFAMVIAGMGASLPEVTILSGIFQPRLLAAFLASVFATAVLGGLLIPALS